MQLRQSHLAQATLVIGLIGSSYAVVDAVTQAYAASDRLSLFATLTLIPSVLAFAFALRFLAAREKTPNLPARFGDALHDRFTRPDAVSAIAGALRDPTQLVTILFGTSGTGKSIIVKELLKEYLENEGNARYLYFRPNGQLRTEFQTKLRELDPKLQAAEDLAVFLRWPSANGKTIVVAIDQAERLWQLSPHDADKRKDDVHFLRAVIGAASSYGSLKVLIAIRKEMLCEAIAESLETHFGFRPICLSGIPVNTDDQAYRRIWERIRDLAPNPHVANRLLKLMTDADGRILPIKAHLITVAAKLLEFRLDSLFGAGARANGDCDILVSEFFNAFERASPDREAFRRIFLSLCLLRVRALGATAVDLARITHEEIRRVQAVVNYLEDSGLVTRTGATVEVVHDYIAEVYAEYAAEKVDFDIRNNITYFVDLYSTMRLEESKSHVATDNSEFTSRGWCLAALSSLCLWRFFFPGTFGGILANLGVNPAEISPGQIDLPYLPVLVAHLSWVYYILSVCEGLFLRVREDATQRAFTHAVALNAVAMAILGTIRTDWWVQEVAWGGFLLALKCIYFAWKFPLSPLSRDDFMGWGVLTLLNMLILFAIGTVVTVFVYGDGAFDLKPRVMLVNAFLGMVLTYFWKVMWDRHASSTSCRKLLGFVDRLAPKPIAHAP